jgi:hypothetical protein
VSATVTDANGVLRYYISDDASAPSANSFAGTAYAALSGLNVSSYLSQAESRRLYLHAIDNAGKTGTVELTNGRPVSLDGESPDSGALSVTDTASGNATYSSGTVTLDLSGLDDSGSAETGSGIKKLLIGGSGLSSIASAAVKGSREPR